MIDFTSGPLPSGWTASERDAVEKVKARHRRRLKKLDVSEISLVPAGANPGAHVLLMKRDGGVPVTVAKLDEDKRRVFGFASVSTARGAELVDSAGDTIDPDTLEEAVAAFQGTVKRNHQGSAIARVIESALISKERADAMGLAMRDPSFVGWWIGAEVFDDEVWKAAKAGEFPMFSIGGRAQAEPVGKSRSRERSVAPAAAPNPEREAFLKARAADIRRNGERPSFVPETAPERQHREITKAKKRAVELLQQLKERTR